MTAQHVVFPENMDTLKGLPYDENTKKYYVDPNPLVDGETITTKGESPNRKLTVNRQGMGFLAGDALGFDDQSQLNVQHDSSLFINGSNQLGVNAEIFDRFNERLEDLYNRFRTEDKLLEKVEYSQDTKELLFYVGNPLKDGDESILRVSVSDLLPVVSGNGLEGTGTAGDPLRVKVDPTSTGLSVGPNGTKVTTPTLTVTDDENNYYINFAGARHTIAKGLTCATIANLPKATWERGMSVLAKRANGQCVNLVPFDSIFQTTNLAARFGKIVRESNQTYNTLTGFMEDTYFITYTITNTGESPSTAITLTIQEPKLENPDILRSVIEGLVSNNAESVSSPAFDAVNRRWTMTIRKLAVGGNVTLTWKANASQARTYQVSAKIEVDPGIHNSGNQLTTTHTLSVNNAQNDTVINNNQGEQGTADCPFITATLNGKAIYPTKASVDSSNLYRWRIDTHSMAYSNSGNWLFGENFVNARSNFKFTGAKQVYVIRQRSMRTTASILTTTATSNFGNYLKLESGYVSYEANEYTSMFENFLSKDSTPSAFGGSHPNHGRFVGVVEPVSLYTFNTQTGDLSIQLKPSSGYFFFVRGGNPKCIWQLFTVYTPGTGTPVAAAINDGAVTGITNGANVKIQRFNDLDITYRSLTDPPSFPDVEVLTQPMINDIKAGRIATKAIREWNSGVERFDVDSPKFERVIVPNRDVNYTERWEIALKKGQSYNFTVRIGYNWNMGDRTRENTIETITSTLQTRGEITIEKIAKDTVRVTVTPRANESNDVVNNYLRIRMVDNIT